MWELDCEEGWAPKNWCFWTVVLEKTLESPLDCREIQPVHSEGDQPWDFFGRNDAKAETPILWLPHAKSWLIGKDSDAGRDWGQEEQGTTEDEMVGWHHGLDGRESEWTPGVGDGQGGLACCDSWGRKESNTTERLNWLTTLKRISSVYGGDMRHTSKSREREIKWAWRILQNMWQKQSVMSQYPWIPYISSFPCRRRKPPEKFWPMSRSKAKWECIQEDGAFDYVKYGASMLGTENWLRNLAMWRPLLSMIKIVSL